MKNRMPLLLILLSVACLVVAYFSLTNGAADISRQTIWQALTDFDKQDQTQQIIRNIRFPRILAGFFVGSALAVSGALMQGITKNPLADSGLLGINSGSSLGLALCFIFFPQADSDFVVFFSFAGAFIGTGIIFLITRYSTVGMSPTRLILAGVAISAFFSAVSQALALQFDLQQDLAFWFIGGVANISWSQFYYVLPFYLCATFLSLIMAPQINVLALGDETAVSLGKSPLLIRTVTLIVVAFLAGLAVSLVGPVSFIGLMVPHVLRYFVGDNYRQLIPLSILAGGLLVILADFIARMVNPPFETPFGIVISLIGVPFLLVQVRRIQA